MSTVVRRLDPIVAPMAPEEIMSHLRISDAFESTLIEDYLVEALGQIESVCQRSVAFGRYELILPRFPSGSDALVGPLPFTDHHPGGRGKLDQSYLSNSRFSHISPAAIELWMPPVKLIESIKYYDVDESLQTMDSGKYMIMDQEPAILGLQPNETWPTVQHRRDAITITFWAGETDELIWSSGPTFQSMSGYPWANGDQVVLRSSGNRNQHLGDVSTLPGGFVARKTYFVVGSDDAGSFSLSATVDGGAISGTNPVYPEKIERLFAGQLTGPTAMAVRKIATESYSERCPSGSCSCSGQGEGYFQQDPMMARLIYRSPFQA